MSPHCRWNHCVIKAIALVWMLGLQSCVGVGRWWNPSPKPDPLFPIESAAGVDYRSLQGMLRQRQWRGADQETLRILLEMGDRQSEGWLSQPDVESLACADLQTIAKLWDYYSDGRFGWMRQLEIWQEVGGTAGVYDAAVAEQVGDRVGWRRGSQWRTYDQLNFSEQAPAGHLPATTGNGVSGAVWNGVAAITHRAKYCPIIDALVEQRWVDADWRTLGLLEPYRVPQDDPIDPAPLDLALVPCHELAAIDRLWSQYSNNRFGLSAQTPILKATGNDPTTTDWQRHAAFERAVGWDQVRVKEREYNTAPLEAIPTGHFPYRLGYSYETFGSGFDRAWRLELKPECGFY
ncbi:MAG TPA: GUN4 domain-containing protein [Chroococcidiopsis sp.]